MKLELLQVGRARMAELAGKQVRTAIFKEPVSGRVAARRLGLEGDDQADKRYHGGPFQAVYAYPLEHYPWWRERFADPELLTGCFGENLVVSGLLERDVRVGDRFRIGSAELVATQPRVPCNKLAGRLERKDVGKLMLTSGRTGWYMSVAVEGELGAGDELEYVSRDERDLTIHDLVRLVRGMRLARTKLELGAEHEALDESGRRRCREQLDELGASQS